MFCLLVLALASAAPRGDATPRTRPATPKLPIENQLAAWDACDQELFYCANNGCPIRWEWCANRCGGGGNVDACYQRCDEGFNLCVQACIDRWISCVPVV